jgi:hypothetical protein
MQVPQPDIQGFKEQVAYMIKGFFLWFLCSFLTSIAVFPADQQCLDAVTLI